MSTIHLFPGYATGPRPSKDVALLRVRRPVTFSNKVFPACVNSGRFPANDVAAVSGFYTHTHTQWEWGKGRKTAWKLPIPLDLERKTFINTRRFWTYTDLKTNDKTTKYICLKGCPQTCVLVRILLSHRRRKTKWTVNFGRLEQSVLIKGLWLRLQKKHPVQRLVYKTCDTATSKNGDYDRFYCLSPSDIFHQGSRRWNMSYFVHLSTRWLVRMVWISGIYNC